MGKYKKIPRLTVQESGKILSLADAVVSRAQLASYLGQTGYGTNRDIYKALGYLKNIRWEDYYARYMRQGVAKRIIHAFPDGCWGKRPEIVENQKEETDFEKKFRELERKTKLFHYLQRTDRIAGIGEYAVLLMGFNDGKELNQPVTSAKKLMYLRPYTQKNAEIADWEQDSKNERYGLPLTYKLTAANSDRNGTQEFTVHHSRIIHASDGLIEDEVFGVPRLMPIFNYLQDLDTVGGGSGEMYWRGAFPGMAFKLDPESDNTQLKADMKTQIEEYIHGLQRILRLQGVDIQQLSPNISDPSPHIRVLLTLISISIEIPTRILQGSERGELASTQDETAWNGRVEERRDNYVEPFLLRPAIDKLIELKILPTPTGGYEIEWPGLHEPTDKDVADVNKIKTETLVSYADSPNASILLPPRAFFKDTLGYSDEDVDDLEQMSKDMIDEEQKQIETEEKIRAEIEAEQGKDDDVEEAVVEE